MSRINSKKETIGYIYIIMVILCSLIGITMLILAFIGKEEKIVFFSEKADIEDIITLKDNNYFEEKELKNQTKYITSLIDKMTLNFKYSLAPSENIQYDKSYYITANLKIYEVEEEDNIYWSKEETLVENKELPKDNNNIEINESVDVDFNRYNQLVEDFSKDYALMLDSTLDIELHVVLKNKENKQYNKTKTITATIPMNKQSFSITKDYNKEKLENVNIKTQSFNVVYFIFSILILIFDFIFIKRIIDYLKNNVLNRSKYRKELDKILKTYDQIIVISKNPPDIASAKKVEVENFEELLDAQEELNNPIIFYEDITLHKGVFVIMGDDIAWIYNLIDEENKNIEIL